MTAMICNLLMPGCGRRGCVISTFGPTGAVGATGNIANRCKIQAEQGLNLKRYLFHPVKNVGIMIKENKNNDGFSMTK